MVELKIEGMVCSLCVATVTKAVEKAAPQARVTVDLPGKNVRLDGPFDEVAVKMAIRRVGYDVA